MKLSGNIYSIIVLMILLIGCKSEEPEINENLQILKSLEGSYHSTSISLDGSRMEHWKNFGLDLHLSNDSKFDYFAYHMPSDSISQLTWPINGSLQFKYDEDINHWVRDDGIDFQLSFNAQSLFMSFLIPFEPKNQCDSMCILPIYGNWDFALEKISSPE